MKTKTIRLLPTQVELDIIVSSNSKEKEKHLLNKYNVEHETIFAGNVDSFAGNMVRRGCGCDVLVLVIHDFDVVILAHEAVHVTWYLQKIVGPMFNFDAQETQAYLVSYIIEEVLKMKK